MKKMQLGKEIIKTVVITSALVACPTMSALAAEKGFNPDAIGRKFWGVVKIIARWGCICMCAIRIIQNLGVEDAKGMLKIFFKYALAYGLIVLLPDIFDTISEF